MKTQKIILISFVFQLIQVNDVRAPVVQKVNSAIHRINHYPVDKY